MSNPVPETAAEPKRRRHRGHHEGTIKERKDGRWEAMVSLPNGKRRSLYGKTRKEAQDKLRQALRDADAGLDLGARRQTVEEFLDRWLADTVKPKVRPKTHHSYAQIARLHLIPELGRHRLDRLTPQHVQALLAAKTAAGLSPRTVGYVRAILRQALGQALKWGMVSRNVAALVDPPRAVRTPVKPLTPDQARAFLDASRGDRLGPLFAVAVLSGLRQGELFGLRWGDVDLRAGTLTVRHAMQRIGGKPTLVEPKTERSRRTLALPAAAAAALREQRTRQLEERLLAGNRWRDWDLVFASTIGTPLEPSNVGARLHALLAGAGLPRQRFHDLRHCCASLLLSQRVPPRVLMDVLGHSQISLTMNTYAHIFPEAMRDAADALDAAMATGS